MPLLSRKRKIASLYQTNLSNSVLTDTQYEFNGDKFIGTNTLRESIENHGIPISCKVDRSLSSQHRAPVLSCRNSNSSILSQFQDSQEMSKRSQRDQTTQNDENSKRRKIATKSTPNVGSLEDSIPNDDSDLFDREDFREASHVNISNHIPIINESQETIQSNFEFPSSQFPSQYDIKLERNLNINFDNSGDIGHIQEITLKNFMCHKHFHLELGPRINFIVGENGSGKSAILNGIIIGLGGRATNTNRGSGLATFIKNGETKAQIIIKLSNYVNENDDSKEFSYMFERYGKTIIIERTLTIAGTSSYKIKSNNGKIVSEKKEELDHILKHFSICVDNPICVLTQEVSKNFLNSKSAADKYNFFSKATQIEDTRNDYLLCQENYEKCLKLVEEKEKSLNIHKEKLEEYRQKVEIIELLQSSVKKIKKLNEETIWASINEDEQNLEKLSSKLSENENIYQRYLKDLQLTKEKIDIIQRQKQQCEDKKKNFENDVKRARTEWDETKEQFKETRKKLTDKEMNLRIIKNDVNSNNRDIEDLKKRISGIERTSQENENMDFETLIENLVNEMTKKKTMENELKARNQQMQTIYDEKMNERVYVMQEERKISSHIVSCSEQLKHLNKSDKNRLARYGQKYPELHNQIQMLCEQNKFKRKPFGPIGEYIRLEDSSAAFAVECCLKSYLKSFVVDNGDDAVLLQDEIRKLFGDHKAPTIIIRKYCKLHDVSNTQVISDKYKNFLQLLNIKRENDPVANCLIDHLRIEQILYIPDFKEAQHMLIRKELVPSNCKTAFTSTGDLMYPSNEQSDYKCYPNRRRNKFAMILSEDQEKVKQNYCRQIEELKHKHGEVRAKMKDLHNEISEHKKELDGIKVEIHEIRMEFINLENKLSELKTKAQVKPIEAQALKEEVQKLEEERDNLLKKIDEIISERDELSKKNIELTNEVDAKERAFLDVTASAGPIQEEIINLSNKLKNLQQKNDFIEKNKQDLLIIKENQKSEIKILEDKIKKEQEKALECTQTRIKTSRTVDEIRKEIKRIDNIIKTNEEVMCDPNEKNNILKQHFDLKNSVRRIQRNLNGLKNYLNILKKSLNHRNEAYKNLQHYMSLTINKHFQQFLQQKEFDGSIKINFEDLNNNNDNKKGKTLVIDIKPRKELMDEMENSSFSSTKTLSGGERSFSTVAFIIALWQICKSPFKILDEVDVFMDIVTRKISLDTLVEFAALKSHKQFIFLSPLQIQQFEHVDCLKIFTMPKPIRPESSQTQ